MKSVVDCQVRQPVLHLVIAGFTCGVVLMFHSLARRIAVERALLLTALLVLGPAFLPSQNLMVDVPLLFFWLLVVWALFAAATSRTGWYYGLSSAMIALACLTKYSSLVLLPLHVVMALLRRHVVGVWFALVPLGALVAWSCFNLFDYGGVHILNRPQLPFTIERVVVRVVEWVAAVGAAAPFSLAFLPCSRRNVGSWVSLATGVAVGVVAGWALGSDHRATAQIAVLWAVFIGNGVFVFGLVGQAAVRAIRRGDRLHLDRATRDRTLVLVLWLAGTSLFMALFAPFMSMRSVLLAVPALLLLLPWTDVAGAKALRTVALVITVLLGMALAVSDYHYAAVYRDQAQRLIRQAPQGSNVWFIGHWGWQWYAKQAGMKPYDPNRTELAAGDYLVQPKRIHGSSIADRHHARLIRFVEITVEASPWLWLRTIAVRPPGGFYSFFLNNGAPPWRFSTDPIEQFVIYRVVVGETAGHSK